MKYKQGEIAIINFPFTDIPGNKKRPALVISNEKVSITGEYIMVQITSKEKFDDLSIPINKTDYIGSKELPLKSYIRPHKIFLLNESLIISKFSSVKSSFQQKVIDKIIELVK